MSDNRPLFLQVFDTLAAGAARYWPWPKNRLDRPVLSGKAKELFSASLRTNPDGLTTQLVTDLPDGARSAEAAETDDLQGITNQGNQTDDHLITNGYTMEQFPTVEQATLIAVIDNDTYPNYNQGTKDLQGIKAMSLTNLAAQLKPLLDELPSVDAPIASVIGRYRVVADAVSLKEIRIGGVLGLAKGSSTPKSVTAYYTDGSTQDVTGSASKSVSNDALASWSLDGTLTAAAGLGNNTIVLTATYQGKSFTQTVALSGDTAPYEVSRGFSGLGSLTEGSGLSLSINVVSHMSSGPDQPFTGGKTYSKADEFPPGAGLTLISGGGVSVSAPNANTLQADQVRHIRCMFDDGTAIEGEITFVNTDDVNLPMTGVSGFTPQLFDTPLAANVLPTGWLKPNGGSWQVGSGELCQNSDSTYDDNYVAVITENGTYQPANSTIIKAIITPRSFTNNSETTRFGVGLRHGTSANSGGYNLLFYNNTGYVEFLHDGQAHGPHYAFNWQGNVQYGFLLEYMETPDGLATLRGRIWKMTDVEPTTYPYQWVGVPRQSGYPALILGACLTAGEPSKACCQEVYTFKPNTPQIDTIWCKRRADSSGNININLVVQGTGRFEYQMVKTPLEDYVGFILPSATEPTSATSGSVISTTASDMTDPASVRIRVEGDDSTAQTVLIPAATNTWTKVYQRS
jgi:hypothetical protein